MDKPIADIFNGVLFSAESKVALFVEPHFWRLEALDQDPLSDIKFFAFYNQRVLYVFLDHELHFFEATVVDYLKKVVKAANSSSSAQKVRFRDPDIPKPIQIELRVIFLQALQFPRNVTF